MKFLKSTLAIVALFAIASVDAKQMKKTGQPSSEPMVQPIATQDDISSFINRLFDARYDEMVDVILNDNDEQQIDNLISSMMQIIANEFPMNIAAAKNIFNEDMMIFCESIQGDQGKMMFIQQCINNNKAMNVPSATNVTPNNTNRNMNRRNMNRNASHPHMKGKHGRHKGKPANQ